MTMKITTVSTFDSAAFWGQEEIQVLHVDDEQAMAEVAADRLESAADRLTVVTETEPYDALDVLEAREVDCVVSDYEMPDLDGLGLLEAIRERAPDLPFILFTGKGSEEIASDAISAGVTDYLQKESGTGQYELLANRIENAVERYRQAREHELVHEALEAASEGIAILDPEGRLVYANRAFAILYGDDPTGFLGSDIERFYPAEEARRIRETVFPAVEKSGAWRGQTRGLRADEATFPQSLSVTQLDDGGYVCVVRDISDHVEREQALERERNRARALFENLAEPVAYYEFEGQEPVAREINSAFAEVFGVTEAEAMGRSLDDLLVPEDHAEEGQQINERVRAGDIIDVEVEREAADGVRTFDLLSVPLEPEKNGERGFTIYRTR